MIVTLKYEIRPLKVKLKRTERGLVELGGDSMAHEEHRKRTTTINPSSTGLSSWAQKTPWSPCNILNAFSCKLLLTVITFYVKPLVDSKGFSFPRVPERFKSRL